MTLMNRLNVIPPEKTYCVRRIFVPGIDRVGFAAISRHLERALFDPSTGQGNFVLYNPARIETESAINVIAVGDSRSHVKFLLEEVFAEKMAQLVQQNELRGIQKPLPNTQEPSLDGPEALHDGPNSVG